MRLHVAVRGRVQGVGFRHFARQAAQALDLAGWVRNMSDGSVEVAAEGDAASIEALRAKLRDGPSSAMVTSVDDLGAAAEALDRPFTILR